MDERPPASGQAGRVSRRQILHRSDCNAALHPKTVIDYEKAFDSLDRQNIWKLLRHCGIPEKIISIIRNSYSGMTCRVVCGHQLIDAFQVKTRVRQGFLLSPFLFLLGVEDIHSPKGKWNSMDSLNPI